MAVIHCSTAELKKRIAEIHAGDEVFLSGTVYTARDAAHKRIRALLEAGEPLPFPLEGAVIYYAGPTPERPGCPIGSCGRQRRRAWTYIRRSFWKTVFVP